jgi:hypothetical protein
MCSSYSFHKAITVTNGHCQSGFQLPDAFIKTGQTDFTTVQALVKAALQLVRILWTITGSEDSSHCLLGSFSESSCPGIKKFESCPGQGPPAGQAWQGLGIRICCYSRSVAIAMASESLAIAEGSPSLLSTNKTEQWNVINGTVIAMDHSHSSGCCAFASSA